MSRLENDRVTISHKGEDYLIIIMGDDESYTAVVYKEGKLLEGIPEVSISPTSLADAAKDIDNPWGPLIDPLIKRIEAL